LSCDTCQNLIEGLGGGQFFLASIAAVFMLVVAGSAENFYGLVIDYCSDGMVGGALAS